MYPRINSPLEWNVELWLSYSHVYLGPHVDVPSIHQCLFFSLQVQYDVQR